MMSKGIQGNGKRSGNRHSAAYDAMTERIAPTLVLADKMLAGLAEEGVWVRGFSLRAPSEEKPDWLVTVRAETEQGFIVAFSGGDSLAEALVTTLNRVQNRSLKWREDNWSK